jgi:hypothetical protein
VHLSRVPSPALVRLAGLVAGDGHLDRSSVELTSGEPAVLRSFASLCEEVFGTSPRERRTAAPRCPTLVLGSAVAADTLSEAFAIPFGAKASRVRAPGWLLAAPVTQIAAYMSGLLDTDGSVRRATRAAPWSNYVEFCTTSPGLAEDVVALLLRLGVRSHVARRARCTVVRVYDPAGVRRLAGALPLAHPRRASALRDWSADSGFFSNVDLVPGLGLPFRRARQAAGLTAADFATRLGVSRRLVSFYERGERLPTRARAAVLASRAEDAALVATLHSLATLPVHWDRVVAAHEQRDHGESYVYDLTVPQTHTFLVGAGGIVAHNTTLLNALGAAIASDQERLCTIEDVPELTLDRVLPDCVALLARPGNVEGAGEIRIRDLVRDALRLRPSRIVVGEVRGPEALDMLQAMNTGHEGSLSSVHANSPRDALDRLVTLATMAEERIPAAALARMVARAIQLIVHLRFEHPTGRRYVQQVFEVTGLEGDVVTGNDLWVHDPGAGRLRWTGIRPRCLAQLATRGVPYELPPASEVPA